MTLFKKTYLPKFALVFIVTIMGCGPFSHATTSWLYAIDETVHDHGMRMQNKNQPVAEIIPGDTASTLDIMVCVGTESFYTFSPSAGIQSFSWEIKTNTDTTLLNDDSIIQIAWDIAVMDTLILSYTDTNSNTSFDSLFIQVNPKPPRPVFIDAYPGGALIETNLCMGTTTNLWVDYTPYQALTQHNYFLIYSGNVTVKQSGIFGISTSGGHSSSPDFIYIDSTTSFRVVVEENQFGCLSDTSEPRIITVFDIVNLNITSDTTICQGTSIELNAIPEGGYWTNTQQYLNSVDSSGSYTGQTTGTDTLIYTYAEGMQCEQKDSVKLTVRPLPFVSTPTNDTVCSNGSIYITSADSSNTNSLQWEVKGSGTLTNETSLSPTYTPAAQASLDTLILIGYGGNCDFARDTVFIVINQSPTAAMSGDTNLCPGESGTVTVDFTGTGPWNFVYSIDGTSQSPITTPSNPYLINVNPAATTNYGLVSVENAACPGSVSGSATVTINTLPTVSASATPNSICEGESTEIKASGASTYDWDNSLGAGDSLSVSPASSRTYTVTGTDVNGCTNTASVTVTVNAVPTVSASASPTTICEGESTDLTASGATTYNWSAGGGDSTITVSPIADTTYTVTGTSNGCSATASVLVTVNPNPVVSIAVSDDTLCAGESTDLTASGADSYIWSTTETTTTINVSPADTTSYTVSGTTSGCTATAEVEVIVNALPVITLTVDDDTLCAGESADLTASGADSYIWSTTETTATINVSPADTTSYTVSGTTSGCTANADTIIVVNDLPDVSITANANKICRGESTELTASRATSYVWSTSDSIANITVNPTETTTYAVTGTDSNGCQNIAEVTITVYDLPVADAGADTSIYANSSASLSGTASGGSETYSYEWSPADSLVDANVQNPTTVNLMSTNEFSLLVTDNKTQCISEAASMTVHVIGPGLSVSPRALQDTICIGDSTTLNANATGGSGNYTYSWTSDPPGFTSNIKNPVDTPSGTTKYYIRVDDDAKTSVEDSVTVIVNALPVLTLTAVDNTLCEDESTDLNVSGADTYLWSTTETDSTINVSPTTTKKYRVNGTSTDGCVDSTSIEIVVNLLPPVDIMATDPEICIGDSTDLTASGADTYVWSTTETTTMISVSPTSTTTYSVKGTDAEGCINTSSIAVTVDTLPVVEATAADDSICDGESTTLTATGADTYEWSTTESTAQISVSPSTTTTTYSLTGTSASGCVNTAEVTVTVNALPTVIANAADDTLCLGESTTLTATGADSYLWSTTETTAQITVSPTANMTYTLSGNDANRCSNTASVDIVVNNLPVVDITALADTLCLGESTDLTAAGADTYLWSTTGTTPQIGVSPTAGMTYTVTGTDTNGCTNTAAYIIVVNGLPTITALADPAEICIGGSSDLTAGGAETYVWSTTATAASITENPTATTTYSVSGTDIKGCQNTTDLTVTVNDLPVADAGADTAICFGDSTMLDASGGIEYEWTPAQGLNHQDIQNPVVKPFDTTCLFVTVSDMNGCSSTDSVKINVIPLPQVEINSNAPYICDGDTAVLTASGASSYRWWNDSTFAEIMVSPQTTNEFSVIGTSAEGCSSSDSITLVVHTLPSVFVSATLDTICEGETTTLMASNATSHQWITTDTTQQISVSPTTSYHYVVAGTNSLGCKDTAGITITVNPLPSVYSHRDTICRGDSAILTGYGALNYLWSGTDTSDYIKVSPDSSTTYKVVGTDINGCSDTAYADVIVNSLPNADAGNDTVICSGVPLQLNATGGNQFTWFPAQGLSDDSIHNPIATLTYASSFTVTVTNNNNCQDTAQIMIGVNPLPPAGAGNDTEICFGESTQLNASGGDTYLWSPPNSLYDPAVQNPIANPATTTTYSVTVTNSSTGCQNTDQVVVAVNSLPPANAGNDTEICLGESTQLNASGGDTYLWSPPNSLNDTAVQNPIANPATTTTYSVTVTNSSTGCQKTDQVVVSVNPLPPANAGNDAEICLGESTQLNASGGHYYSWSPDTTLNNYSINNPIAAPDITTTYKVTVTNAFTNCQNSDSVVVTVHDLPSANAGNDTAICRGESTILNASGGGAYLWSPTNSLNDHTAQNPSANPTNTTTYKVTVTDDGTGCQNTDQVTVTVNDLPPADAGPDQTNCAGASIPLNASGGVSYQWSPTIGLSNPYISNPFAILTSTRTYTVTVTDNNHCENTDQVQITVRENPEPHDILGPETICRNEYGIVFETHDVAPGYPTTLLWEVPQGVTILAGQTTDILTVHWSNDNTQLQYIDLQVTRPHADISCARTFTKQISVSPTHAPDTSEVIIMFDNTLICLDTTVAHYQWGKTDQSGIEYDIAGATSQYTYIENLDPGTYFYWVKTWNDPECKTTSYYNWPNWVTIVPDRIAIEQLKLYPNPTNDVVYLLNCHLLNFDYIYVSLYDQTGKRIVENQIHGNPQSQHKILDLSGFSKGIYIISLHTEKQVLKNLKLIKQ